MNYSISIAKLFKYIKQFFHLSFIPLFLAFKYALPGAFIGLMYMGIACYVYLYVKKVDINEEPVMIFSILITAFLYSGL